MYLAQGSEGWEVQKHGATSIIISAFDENLVAAS
jgi:hypothetical protein